MIATAKDLRFNISFLFDVLSKGEDVTITHRGKSKAKLISYEKSVGLVEKDSTLFGMWRDKAVDVNEQVRQLRKKRTF